MKIEEISTADLVEFIFGTARLVGDDAIEIEMLFRELRRRDREQAARVQECQPCPATANGGGKGDRE